MLSTLSIPTHCDLFPNAAPADAPSFPAEGWYMIARVGEWKGHPTAAYRLTPSDLAAIRDYYESRYHANSVDVLVDFEHQSRVARDRGIVAPAAAWIDGMDLRADGAELWAHARWTENARSLLGRREYRYLSPVFVRNLPDPVTGKRLPWILDSVALTNRPFMVELPAVVNATDAAGDARQVATEQTEEVHPMELLKLLAAALGVETAAAAELLGVAADAGDDDVVKAVASRLKPAEAVANAAAAENAVTAAAEASARENARRTDMLVVANALGLPAESARDDVLKRIADLQQSAADDRAVRVIENAVRAGRIAPANRETFLKLARENVERTEALVNSLPVILAPGRTAPPTGDPPSAKKDPKREFENSVELQAEFGDAETYLAYVAAVEEGKVLRVAKL